MIKWKRRSRVQRAASPKFLEAGEHWPILLEMQYYEQLLFNSLERPSGEQLFWHVKVRNAFVRAGGYYAAVAEGWTNYGRP